MSEAMEYPVMTCTIVGFFIHYINAEIQSEKVEDYTSFAVCLYFKETRKPCSIHSLPLDTATFCMVLCEIESYVLQHP
jgi:hypothetical protein